MSAPPDTDSQAADWDRKQVYEFLKSSVVAHQGKESPPAPVADRRRLRGRCCDTGPLSVDRYETALNALAERPTVARGEHYVGVYPSPQMAREAVAWVAETPAPDTDFIGSANQVLDRLTEGDDAE